MVFATVGCNSKKGLGLNETASVLSLGDLPENPLLLHAITSTIQPKDSTTTVLYGNNQAYEYAASTGDDNYPEGAILFEVTWQQQPDEQWFGGKVPKAIKTIERVALTSGGKVEYTLFQGNLHQKTTPINSKERIAHITGQRIAVSP